MHTISEINATAASFVAEISNLETDDGVKVHKWTQKEYYQMAELGFFQGKRVELIEGEIIEMTPMKTAHATALSLITQALNEIFTGNFSIRTQMPMNLNSRNAPEPDAAVVVGKIRDFTKTHPQTAELIVEVSDATLRYDRTTKAALYAQNKIQEYWILNLKDRCLEIYRQPKKDKKLGFIYGEIQILTEDETVSTLANPQAEIRIADLLP